MSIERETEQFRIAEAEGKLVRFTNRRRDGIGILLRLDPMFDPLRNDPRFQKLIASPAPKTNPK